MSDLTVKGLGPLEIKNEEKGEVEAVIATFDVVDRDGDVIRPDAIRSGSTVKVSAYGHDAVWGATPVGKGAIAVEGDKAIFRGKLFLQTARGRETFEVLKEMADDQEWSFGFHILGSEVPDEDLKKKGAFRILTKLDAFEVSPVMRGAGIGTGTLAVKQAESEEDSAEEEPAEPEGEAEGTVEAKAEDAEPGSEEEEEDAEVKEAERVDAELKAAAEEEFARFQRTLRRLGVAR